MCRLFNSTSTPVAFASSALAITSSTTTDYSPSHASRKFLVDGNFMLIMLKADRRVIPAW